MDRPTPESARLPLLDGMRGIAAIGVMLYHAQGIFGLSTMFNRGYMFVDFFFLLSGFVLTLSAEPKMAHPGGATRFLRDRVRRLWPMIAIGIAVGFIENATLGVPLPTLLFEAVLGLAMIPVPIGPCGIFPLNAPQWSLLMELLANLEHVMVFRHLKGRALVVLTACWGGLFAFEIWHFGRSVFGPGTQDWPLAAPRVLFSYSVGIIFARNWANRKARFTIPWAPAMAFPVVVIWAVPYIPLDGWICDAAVVLLILPFSFMLISQARPPRVGQTLLTFLGRISFPLYTLEMPILWWFSRLQHQKEVAVAAMMCALVLSYILSIAMNWPSRRPPTRPRLGAYATAA